VPTLDVAIHDVVVQQREVVHQFDRDSRGDPLRSGTAARFGSEHGERRPDRLPACTAPWERSPVGVQPAQVVRSDPAHVLAVEPVDGGAQSGGDEGSGPSEDGGWLDSVEPGQVLDTVEGGVLTLVSSAKLIHVIARRTV